MDFMDIDLEPIKFKLMSSDGGMGWSLDFCDRVEVQYKRWMTLVVKYPEQVLIPNKNVDSFWHHHILDTQKYWADCFSCFGRLVHHYPYTGMTPESTQEMANENWNITKELYKVEYGQEFGFVQERLDANVESSKCTPGMCYGQDCNSPGECQKQVVMFDDFDLTKINLSRPRPARVFSTIVH